MDENQVRQIVQEEIKKSAQNAQYSVNRTPVHTHNKVDSPSLQPLSVNGFQALPGTSTNTSSGIADPDFLDGQSLIFGDIVLNTTNPEYTNIYEYPLSVIYGSGTSSTDTLFDASVTMTGTPIAGATTATLTGNWTDPTGTYWVTFVSGEIRLATLTNASTAVTWVGVLTVGAGGAGLTVGPAPIGATSAHLTGNWAGSTDVLGVKFSSNEVRNVQFTNGSPVLTWSQPLIWGATTAITIIGNAQFKGGDAPYGTLIAFRNDDDGLYQLWLKTIPGVVAESWTGVNMGGVGLFVL